MKHFTPKWYRNTLHKKKRARDAAFHDYCYFKEQANNKLARYQGLCQEIVELKQERARL